MSVTGNVTVAVRVRPVLGREVGGVECVGVNATGGGCGSVDVTKPEVKVGAVTLPAQGQRWSFDHCFGPCDTNENVFRTIGLPSVEHAFSGYHACILAYGQTGSGKTHTMEGDNPSDPGLIQRLCSDLFKKSEAKREGSGGGWDFQAEVTYVEIYNEKVRCLLQPKCSDPRIREHPVTGPYVDGATKCAVHSVEDIAKLLKRAGKTRSVAATRHNDRSSRSHALFVVTFTQIEGVRDETFEKESRVTLVDLAGSERAAGTDVSTKEGSNINKSLATLGKVINILSEGHKFLHHVPYRDSILTWMLRESLGGNSKTSMLCTLSPGLPNFDQTNSTLRFADRAKAVTTSPVVNEDPSKRRIRLLIAEVENLKLQLSQQPERRSVSVPIDDDEQSYEELPTSHRLRETEAVLQILKEEWSARVSQFTNIQTNQMESLTKSVEQQATLGNKLQEIVGTLQTKDASRSRRQSLELNKIREALEEVKLLVKHKAVPSKKKPEEPVETTDEEEHPPITFTSTNTTPKEPELIVSQELVPVVEKVVREQGPIVSQEQNSVVAGEQDFVVARVAREQGLIMSQEQGVVPTQPQTPQSQPQPPSLTPVHDIPGMGAPVPLPRVARTPSPQPQRHPPPPPPHPHQNSYVRQPTVGTVSQHGWGVITQAMVSKFGTMEHALNALRRDNPHGAWADLGLLASVLQDVSLEHLTTPFIAAVDKGLSGNVSVEDVRMVLTGEVTHHGGSVRRRECSPEHKLRESSCSTSLPLPSEGGSTVHMQEIERLKEENRVLQKSVEDQQQDTSQLRDDISRLTTLFQDSIRRQHSPAATAYTEPESRLYSPKGKGGLLTSPQPPMNPSPVLASPPPFVGVEPVDRPELMDAAESDPPPAGPTQDALPADPKHSDEYVEGLRRELLELVEKVDAAEVKAEAAVKKEEEATAKLVDVQKELSEKALQAESLEHAGDRARQEAKDLRVQLFRRTQQRDVLQKEQQRWEADIAAARRENIRLQREVGKGELAAGKVEEMEKTVRELQDANVKLSVENKNQQRLIKHREAKTEKEKDLENERQEMVRKNIVQVASVEVEKLRTDLADLTQICASQQDMISSLEAEVAESKQTVKVVKEVGDNAINTLTETLKVTLERLEVYEANEKRVADTCDEMRVISEENDNLKHAVGSLQVVVKQQTDSLADKELQLMRASKPDDDPPPFDIADASPEWRRFLQNDWAASQ